MESGYLSALSVSNFRNFTEVATLELDPRMTVLVGRNNVGKTALLEAASVWGAERPGGHAGARFEFSTTLSTEALLARPAFRDAAGTPTWNTQFVAVARDLDAVTITGVYEKPSSPATAGPVSAIRSGGPFQFTELVLPELSEKAEAGPNGFLWSGGQWGRYGGAGVGELIQVLDEVLARVVYVSPRAAFAHPGPRVMPSTSLEPDGSNIAAVLLWLTQHRRESTLRDLEALLLEAFPDVHGVTAREGTVTDELGIWVIGPRGEADAVPLANCGAGVEQLLMISMVILTADTPRTLILDEPHAYLHPHAERVLLSLLRRHPQHQYVVATHSGVWVNAESFEHVRLVSATETGSVVSRPGAVDPIMAELGIMAGDLWLSEGVTWLEGPSEIAILETCRALMPERFPSGLVFKKMPDLGKGHSDRTAKRTVEVCAQVREAVTGVDVPFRFVFDRDERTPADIDEIERSVGESARFLKVREIENYLLEPDAIYLGLEHAWTAAGLEEPLPCSLDDVERALTGALSERTDRTCFPGGPCLDDEVAANVKGSAVLHKIWQELIRGEYNKVEDGRVIGGALFRTRPDALAELLEVIVG